MNAFELLDGFEFNNHQSIDEKVDTIAALENTALAHKRQPLLPLECQTVVHQPESDARLVRRFEHAWTKRLANSNGGSDDALGDRVESFSHARLSCKNVDTLKRRGFSRQGERDQ